MVHFKNISETLAALSTGAVLLGACASSQTPVNASEVPAAEVSTPAETKLPTEETTEGAAAGTSPTDGSAAATTSSTAVTTPSAAPSASSSAGAPKVPKKGAHKGKPGGQGSCGEGTCG